LVYAHIIGNPQCPLKKFAFVVIFSFPKGIYDLDKDILEKVIGQFTVFGEHVD
jgi:hypothetical protein